MVDLARWPRRGYVAEPTPIQRLRRLSEYLEGPTIWIKRDDLLGFAGGGNKVRKLDYLVADALASGADTLITCGAVQSNHCRLTAAAAAIEGMRCQLVLEERVPNSYDPNATGNNMLFDLLDVERVEVVPKGADLRAAMRRLADDLKGDGRNGYVIPVGGSTPLGALGYVACAQEIEGQAFQRSIAFDTVVCASGSSGTHTGLLAGARAANGRARVVGISVSRGRQEQVDLVRTHTQATLALMGLDLAIAAEDVVVFDEYVGPGYSLATPAMVEAVELLARLEGVLLDPVYTGKAMSGLIDLVRRRRLGKDQHVLFVHTGGVPALYAYRSMFTSGSPRPLPLK